MTLTVPAADGCRAFHPRIIHQWAFYHQTVHHWPTETPDNSLLSSSPLDRQRTHWAVHHQTGKKKRPPQKKDNSPALGQFTIGQTVHHCHWANRKPKQFTIRLFTTGQTETPDNSLGSSPPDKQKPQTIHHQAEHWTLDTLSTGQRKNPASSPTDKQKHQIIQGWAVHHQTNRNPKQFTIR